MELRKQHVLVCYLVAVISTPFALSACGSPPSKPESPRTSPTYQQQGEEPINYVGADFDSVKADLESAGFKSEMTHKADPMDPEIGDSWLFKRDDGGTTYALSSKDGIIYLELAEQPLATGKKKLYTFRTGGRVQVWER